MAHAKTHLLQVPSQRQQFERHLSQTHLLVLESLPESRGQLGFPLETEMLAAAIFVILFYQTDTCIGGHHCGTLTLAY